MSKIKIVIASVLKPVDDPRSYKRFGLSLAKTNKYEINIIGNTSKINPDHPAIKFHVLRNTFGLSLARLLNRWRVLKKITLLKPQILIITTHEILLATTILKFFFRYKLIYDIQENYLRNFWFQNNYFWFFKYPYGLLVRMKEIICSYFIDGSILAEEGYQKEFRFFHKKPFVVLQNKASIIPVKLKKQARWNELVFTGNLSVNSGVLRAINLVSQLHEINNGFHLNIIGHSPDKRFRNQLQQICQTKNFITLISGENPISHDTISAAITNANAALVSYNINPSNENCIPSKVFEYLYLGFPFISDINAQWTTPGMREDLAIPIDFNKPDLGIINSYLQYASKTQKLTLKKQYSWEKEESKLIEFIHTIN